MSAPLHVIVLAAGQGKRMRSAHPKVLQKLGGRPLLEHVLSLAARLDAAKVTVVYGHGGEDVRAWGAGTPVDWVLQDPPRGTGDAVRKVLLPEPKATPNGPGVALILYGDVPLLQPSSLQPLIAAARAGHLALLTQELADPTGYGRITRTPAGAVTGIVEHKDATPGQRAIREVHTGILAAPETELASWVATLNCQNAQQEYYLTDVVASAAKAGKQVLTFQPGHAWEADGINDPVQLARLERTWQHHQATELLRAGVRLADPARIDIRGKLQTGRDVEIDIGCVFVGTVELGDEVVIEPYCMLTDCTVAAGAHIRAYSHLEGASVGAGAVVGPYARLRPGTTLAAEVHIGNFVEVKNSHIGHASKANHLSYVGDSDVGSRVNIGAGVITCNYDGANKHRTIIGDDAFIGSDAQLVAPVTVGRGATIGAGTTLVSDAPPDRLTLSRANQHTSARWTRPQKKR